MHDTTNNIFLMTCMNGGYAKGTGSVTDLLYIYIIACNKYSGHYWFCMGVIFYSYGNHKQYKTAKFYNLQNRSRNVL